MSLTLLSRSRLAIEVFEKLSCLGRGLS